MLKPQQHGELLRHESLPVWGKPWYWQRSSSTMESTRSLAQVVMEMRDEIKKLETVNRALRGELSQQQFGTTPGEAGPGPTAADQRVGMEDNPYVNLRRNVSAPALEGKYKENIAMTVRRYSISSNLSGGVTKGSGRAVGFVRDEEDRRTGDSSWGRVQQEVQRGTATDLFTNPTKDELEKLTNRRSLQEFVHRNRAKVKTVTFLLPVDDIYTNRPVLTKHLEDKTELDSVAETES